MYDILIRNGMVIDGSGSPMFRSDIGIKEGEVVSIGDLRDETGERIIDASGQYVAPGFIDVNNHSDTYWELFRNPGLESLILQGVTTIIGGNSGASLAPLVDSENIRAIQKWTDVESISFNWLSMEEFLADVSRRKLSVNFGTLAGHGTIRRGVLRRPTKRPEESDIRSMEKILKKALLQGALGFSTGLKYTHARLADRPEIIRLLSVLADKNGVYATYLRDEESDLVRSVEEAISSAQEAGVPLHISHLKSVGRKNWHLFEEALGAISTASLNGVDISFDVYPYTMSGSVLYTFLPDWVTESGRQAMLHRLRDFKVRSAVVREMREKGYDYSQMMILLSSLNKTMTRMNIGLIAKAQGQSPEEAIIDVLLASSGRAIVSLEVSSEQNVTRAIRHPFSIISSNGVGYAKKHAEAGGQVHPRNFGTFPRVFSEYVREKKVLSWEEAVHKMTGKPAKKFRIFERGFLQEGFRADIVVFDPETIRDTSTLENSHAYPEGVRSVLVNGEIVVENGEETGRRSGEIIRRRSKFSLW